MAPWLGVIIGATSTLSESTKSTHLYENSYSEPAALKEVRKPIPVRTLAGRTTRGLDAQRGPTRTARGIGVSIANDGFVRTKAMPRISRNGSQFVAP